MVSVPDAVRTALVSTRFSVAVLITAASLVPVMLMVIVLVVPSADLTVKVSLRVAPAARSLCSDLAV